MCEIKNIEDILWDRYNNSVMSKFLTSEACENYREGVLMCLADIAEYKREKLVKFVVLEEDVGYEHG